MPPSRSECSKLCAASQADGAAGGAPDQTHISTSVVERENLTMRMSMRPVHAADEAFSKKVENLRAAASLHFAHYNFVRVHRSLRVMPAMEAGVTDRLWSLDELVERTSV
jgi:hypothetical protein